MSAEASPRSNSDRTKVLIVGGGISGLATAWLARKKLPGRFDIQLLEASDQVGGTTQSVTLDGHVLEKGPNGFLAQRHTLRRFIEELGLGSRIIAADPTSKRRFIFLGDKLRPAPQSPLGLLASPLLSFRGKARLLSEPFRSANPREDESIAQFGYRRIGPEASDVFLDAAVTGIWAGDYSKLSLNACFPMLAEWEREHGSLFQGLCRAGLRQRNDEAPTAGPRFGLLSLQGGMGTLTQELARQLGPIIRTNSPVQSIARTGSTWLASTERDTQSADVMVLTCPAHQQTRIVRPLDAELADDIAHIPYSPLVVCTLTFPREVFADRFRGFGYIAPERLRRPVLGVVFSSEVFPNPDDPHRVHLRALLGGWHQQQVIEWDDPRIVQTVRDDLATALHIRREPDAHWICRWNKGIPQYWVGHHQRLHRIDHRLERWPGLVLAGNAYRGVALHDCVADAERTVDRIRSMFHSS